MMRAAFLTGAAIVSVLLLEPRLADAKAVCDSQQVITFMQKRDLPQGVLSALKFEMADAGHRFQATDVIGPGDESLPFRRFISARQMGCRLNLQYERGGRAYRRETAVFDNVDGNWVLRQAE